MTLSKTRTHHAYIIYQRFYTKRVIGGVSVLTGIGFTMNLFVDSLAYNNMQFYKDAEKLAIFLGSFLSAISEYRILQMGTAK